MLEGKEALLSTHCHQFNLHLHLIPLFCPMTLSSIPKVFAPLSCSAALWLPVYVFDVILSSHDWFTDLFRTPEFDEVQNETPACSLVSLAVTVIGYYYYQLFLLSILSAVCGSVRETLETRADCWRAALCAFLLHWFPLPFYLCLLAALLDSRTFLLLLLSNSMKGAFITICLQVRGENRDKWGKCTTKKQEINI